MTGELTYPIPEQTPPAALLAATIENEGDRRLEDSTFEVWKASFNARTLVLAQGLKTLHRRDLPWNQYITRICVITQRTLFEQAENHYICIDVGM